MSEHQLKAKQQPAPVFDTPIADLVLAIAQDADRSSQPVGLILLEMAKEMDAQLAGRDAQIKALATVAHGHANLLQRLVMQSA